MTFRPHLDAERSVASIVFLNERYRIARETSACSDYEDIDFRRLPVSDLILKLGDIRNGHALGVPVLALNQNTITHNPRERVLDHSGH